MSAERDLAVDCGDVIAVKTGNVNSCETLEIRVSGKLYPGMSKAMLIQSSGYFRAMFSDNFRDSFRTKIDFPALPTSGFDVLLDYMRTKQIVLKGKKVSVIEKALALADIFCVDSFQSEIKSSLISSWSDLEHKDVLSIATLLHADEEVKDTICDQTFKELKLRISNRCVRPEYCNNYENLILVTSKSFFWKIVNDNNCYTFFSGFYDLVVGVLGYAVENLPHLNKMRVLIRHMKLENMPWNALKILLNREFSKGNTQKCLVVATQYYFSELQQEIASRLSHLRVAFRSNRKTSGIMEFNLNTWLWENKFEIRQCKFSSSFCVMSRDHANFFGVNGLMYYRMKYRHPKFLTNVHLTEICDYVDHYYRDRHVLATCTVGRFIYIIFRDADPFVPVMADSLPRPTTLFKIHVFNHHMSDCATFPIFRLKMTARGKVLYLAGVYSNSPQHLVVLSYHTVSGEIMTVAEKPVLEEYIVSHVVLKNKLLYIFVDCAQYLVVDVSKGSDQTLELVRLECFFTQGWRFNILQACSVYDGIMFLIDMCHDCHNCDFLGYMLAHLNTETGEFRSLGFLPNPIEDGVWTDLLYPLCIQMEERKGPVLVDSGNGFAEGIQDLKNLPHKKSSMYY